MEKQSMTVSIVVLLLDLGRSVMKSIARWDHGRWGTGKGCNKPDGSCLGDLLSLQVMQPWIKSVVSVLMVGHQNLFWRRWRVAVIPG